MRVGVFVAQVVAVVGGDERDPGARREGRHLPADLVLDLEPMVLDLEEVVLRPEDLAVLEGGAAGALVVVGEQVARHLALGAGREREQALAVLAQDLVIHARLVVEALEEGDRGEPHQVLEPALVAGQHGEQPERRGPVGRKPVK